MPCYCQVKEMSLRTVPKGVIMELTAPRKLPTPERQQILDQVEAELQRIQEAGETGTVTVHVGVDQMAVHANSVRKHDPVQVKQGHESLLTRVR